MRSSKLTNLLFLMLLLILPACPAVILGSAAGAAGVYYFGELKATRNATLPQAYAASEQALAELGIAIVRREKDGLSAILEGKGAEEKTLVIKLKKIFDDVTEIRIRTGAFGDEDQSRIVLERIEAWLQNPERTAVRPRLP